MLSLLVCFVVAWLVQFVYVDFVLQLALLFCEGEGRMNGSLSYSARAQHAAIHASPVPGQEQVPPPAT